MNNDSVGAPRPVNWKRNLYIIWLGQILALCGNSFALPFIPLYIRDHFGLVDETQRGTVVAMYQFFGTVTFCLSNPLWGMLADRWGRKLMLLRAYFLNAVTIPLMMVAPSVTWLVAIRALVAMFSGTVSASQALIVSNTPEEHHGFALGFLSTALWSGTVLGFLGGGMIVHFFSYRTAFICCGAMFFLSGLLMLFFVRENFVPPPRRDRNAAKAPGGAFPLHLVLLIGFIGAVAMARRIDIPFLPMLVEVVGGADKAALHTSFISALAAAGGVGSGILFGALSDRFPAWKLALPTLLVAGLATLFQSSTDSLWSLGFWRFLCYFAAGGLEPIIIAVIARTVAPERRSTALGWSASIRVAGGVAGAAVSGAVVAHFQTRGVFASAGILMLVLVPLSLIILRRAPAAAPKRR